MKTTNLKNPVRASWIRELGFRLDAGPFISGALEARKTLEALTVRKDSLQDLTRGGIDGIYHAGREGRTWVEDSEFGIPFLSSSDILTADLSNLPLISKRQVASKPQFIIREGWTLITRSGTIGRTVYSRPEMDGMACSEHVMRVVPDAEKVPPGYLFAFINSKFGIPIVVSGTYGSIIQSIEPQHIATLPVPRFGNTAEQRVDRLVREAAELRSSAGRSRRKILGDVERYIGWTSRGLTSLWSNVSSRVLTRRLDGFHHSAAIRQARESLSKHEESLLLIDQVESVFEPNRGARKKVDDRKFGVPFLSSSAVFRLNPSAEYLISSNTPQFEKLLLTERDLLLPRSGQLGGIIGRAVLPLPSSYGSAASEHLVRVRCRSREDAYYLWAVFASQPGYFAAIGTAFGTSIPSLDCDLLSQLRLPWNEGSLRNKVVESVSRITANLDDAIRLENDAITEVERAIEENG